MISDVILISRLPTSSQPHTELLSVCLAHNRHLIYKLNKNKTNLVPLKLMHTELSAVEMEINE